VEDSDYDKYWLVTESHQANMGQTRRNKNLDVFEIHCSDTEEYLLREKQKRIKIDGQSVVKRQRHLTVLFNDGKEEDQLDATITVY
jgi:hypothetical protein